MTRNTKSRDSPMHYPANGAVQRRLRPVVAVDVRVQRVQPALVLAQLIDGGR